METALKPKCIALADPWKYLGISGTKFKKLLLGLVMWTIIPCCSVAKLCPSLCNPWTAAHQAPLFFTISWSLVKFMSFELVMLSNHFILCHPLVLLPSVFPSTMIFPSELALPIRWPKYWSFSFSISSSSEYSGLISFRIDWSDLLSVQIDNKWESTV